MFVSKNFCRFFLLLQSASRKQSYCRGCFLLVFCLVGVFDDVACFLFTHTNCWTYLSRGTCYGWFSFRFIHLFQIFDTSIKSMYKVSLKWRVFFFFPETIGLGMSRSIRMCHEEDWAYKLGGI